MPPRLAVKNMDEIDAITLDELSDGQWHPMNKITKTCCSVKKNTTESKKVTAQEVKDSIAKITDMGYFLAGANNSYRMPEKYVRQWRNSRGLPMETKDSHSPRFFGGILEDDGWEKAPLIEYQLLNFRAASHINTPNIQARIGTMGTVSQVEDGLFRILSKKGEEVYAILKEWDKEEPSLELNGLRLTPSTYRRDMNDLPSAFVDDLCKFYGRFSFILLRRNMSSIKKHLPENDDIQQQIYIWIMDAIARYDDQTCIPFAAYLDSCLKKWVHNLNRKSYGRAAADTELNHARAISKFEAENGRKPSLLELSGLLDETVAKVSKDSLSIKMVANLRAATTLDSDDFTTPLIAKETTDSRVERNLEATLLSAALTAAALEQEASSKGSSLVAFMSIVDKNWNKNKSLAKFYKGKRSSDLSQHENSLLELVGNKINEAYKG